MKQSSIEISEPEELFLLNKFKEILDSQSSESPMFLVGDWVRSKFFKRVCYHYELVCYEKDFESLSGKVSCLLQQEEATLLFKKQRIVKKNSKQKMGKNFSIIIRFFSLNGNKYKISLDRLRNNSFKEDLVSRDFTINSVYLDLNSKSLVANEFALPDFENGIIRTIRSPFETFHNKINLFFRCFEFAVRYNLKVHPEIKKYFSTLNAQTEVFQMAIDFQLNNFNASTKKFFSKHYVSKMMSQMLEVGVIDFFMMSFEDKRVFEGIFKSILLLMEKLELSFLGEFKELMNKTYEGSFPKVFYTKARMFLISFVFFRIDPDYSRDFLSMFLYNKKAVPMECLELHKKLHLLLEESLRNEKNKSQVADFEKVISLIEDCSFDKSKWGFLFVYKVVRENL